MRQVLITEDYLSGIGSAIRSKAGVSEAFKPSEMASAIEAIPSGGSTEREDGLMARTLSEYENSTATEIGSYAFYSYQSLTAASLPNVSYIGGSAFAYCYSLQSVNLPIANYIGTSAFFSCSSLQSVNLPNASYIESNAFRYCSSLQSVDLLSASYIGHFAFGYCPSLQSVNLPMVSYIGGTAFRSCFNLLSLYLGSTSVCSLAASNALSATPIAGYTTSTGGVYGSIYVPASLYSDYITATNWTVYSSRFVSM